MHHSGRACVRVSPLPRHMKPRARPLRTGRCYAARHVGREVSNLARCGCFILRALHLGSTESSGERETTVGLAVTLTACHRCACMPSVAVTTTVSDLVDPRQATQEASRRLEGPVAGRRAHPHDVARHVFPCHVPPRRLAWDAGALAHRQRQDIPARRHGAPCIAVEPASVPTLLLTLPVVYKRSSQAHHSPTVLSL